MTEEHAALRAAVRGLLAEYPARRTIEGDGGFDTALWHRLGKEIGVAGLMVPPEYGGAGATLHESIIVLEELGRALTPAPMLGALLGTQALLATGNEQACARWLPPICAGDLIVAVTWDGVLIDASIADILLVISGDRLYAVDPAAVSLRTTDSLDLTRQLSEITLTDISEISEIGPAEPLHDLACVALSAEQVGTAARALELTVEYAKNRVQFGRPIGAFQALQHRMAEAHVRVEAARSACWTAADALVTGSPDAGRLAAVAKVWCSETVRAVTAEMVQVHGGIAITWEHDAHLYLRRAWSSAQLFGSPQHHLDRLADALLR
ncbi:putative acyl-CoA dehydrogenase [Actinoplanes missouriensis 431]|uniref:Putative acyl-CoA dehydrogenase n=1 Tax=Actinoplanes missouriensis (strain ATCC 14538 / DSM 43046 / CBS 188.64 / JCM 3121 / NBRC 102363 / NCIMB 12654 / NRRL B-3342 / UNCC 431) TaxID=512565 RepID=I0H2A6_ACTM4|nr:acyl-CoA dehydrogenase family protein [Actinoplanes missouriensis]BAL87143.1 putative acyl-CoA dehydrogenase [Actinoplanes missouriensis 431]